MSKERAELNARAIFVSLERIFYSSKSSRKSNFDKFESNAIET